MIEHEPGDRVPAPGGLRLVQAFINTIDREAGRDALGTPEQLAQWLVRQGLADPAPAFQPADLAQAVALRESLRALLRANNGAPLDPAAVATLNRISADVSLHIRFDGQGRAALAAESSGIRPALARLLASVHTAMVDGTWPRLKACRNDVCHWAFYDHSKNRGGTWCTMALCGSRVKTRNYRARHSRH
jgi:predicted RNA-binding Zn ribbon-like protein